MADASALGSSSKFALADHTHRSSVQAARSTITALTNGVALVTWTFSTPFPDDVIPVCIATVENTAKATLPYVVNLVGTPTATAATFIVFKAQSTTLGSTLAALVGAVISPFTNAPAGIAINMIARPPSA